ncbi:putative chromatin regulator PHD family [Helianthus debilis subsp. tardiflorus]
MQIRTSNADGFRISVSNTPSCSNHTSGYDDIESLGDVFLWGEICSDVSSSDGSYVHQIACGVRHYSLVTKQGELFTWGEESGGRLGHGLEKDFGRPRLVEFLAVTNVDYVACGEFHTCAISTSGDLYTWGDGSHNAGLLGHGTDASHWIPKRVSGPLEGLVVCSVACSTWHTALATVDGRLFTFGDGTFGVLGHGDRESLKYPVEVQSLNGLKALKLRVGYGTLLQLSRSQTSMADIQRPESSSHGGDGEKHRLGHGNKETYLKPKCISALMDYNFHQLACVLHTVNSGTHNQTGSCLRWCKTSWSGEFVEEIACGAYHAAVLTSRSEIFTWGMGANGRLGHGDFEDRKTPTLVESLKDRVISRFAPDVNKRSVSQERDITVTNCGLVHCHACSSRKALKAAQAPIPGKPHRVCDSCYAKLIKKPPDVGIGIGNSSNYHRRFSNQPGQDGSRGPGPGPDFEAFNVAEHRTRRNTLR